MKSNQLTLNVLNFEFTVETLTVFVSETPTDEYIKLSKGDCINLSGVFQGTKELYCTFNQPTETSKKVTMPVLPRFCRGIEKPWTRSFLKKYYTHFLTRYFRSVGLPAENNFVSDTTVWIKTASPYQQCDGYRVYTLRIGFDPVDGQPELLVAMGDIRSVYTKPINHPIFSEISDTTYSHVLFRNRIFLSKSIPDIARRHMDEVFPFVSSDLLNKLKIPRPAPENGNRYLKYKAGIEEFRKKYLENKALEKLMLIASQWKKKELRQLETSVMKNLQFGEGIHTDPMEGMKLYGPAEIIKEEVVFFFIMHENHLPLAYTLNDYLTGEKDDFKGGLYKFLRMNYKTEPHKSILFSDLNNPVKEIEDLLKAKFKKVETDKKYVAIYFSPHSKWTRNPQHKLVYYRLKELLLEWGIVSQTIEVDKIWSAERPTIKDGDKLKAVLKGNFHYNLPNILVAIHSKLGYTPWCLENQPAHELVIGISAYKSRDIERKYLGSAFSFTNEGRFQEFDCFSDRDLQVFAGSILLAVKEYCKANEQLSRLVIHFYKKMSRRELEPIEKELSRLRLKIPVIVVSINKSYSEDIVGFDETKPHKMPVSGTYLSFGFNQYLLFNNQLFGENEVIKERQGFPFPLKMKIEQFIPGKIESEPVEEKDIEQLLAQVCRFSQLYWKSVSRQWMPVTLQYPELLAKIVPHFKHTDTGDLGSEQLWFL
jgi:hypothetical protein